MRLNRKFLTNHDLIGGQTTDDHHNQGISRPITVNGTGLAPYSTYQLRIALGKTGYQVIRASLRGTMSVATQGHTGALVVGAASSTLSSSWSTNYSSYVYMGVHSRLHGDSYLSYGMFGATAIHLKDCYVDGSDAVFEFENIAPIVLPLYVYGLLVAK